MDPDALDLSTRDLRLIVPSAWAADRVVDYYERNRLRLNEWEPQRPTSFYAIDYWARELEERRQRCRDGVGFSFFGVLKSDPDGPLVLSINLNNVVRGAMWGAHLGYSIDGSHEGTGLMREAVLCVLELAFAGVGLHRVMANYMPRNERSARLLASIGFRVEGHARSYLCIAGKWEDHVLTAILRDEVRKTLRPRP
jgi:ribosomal-protein-alanine N-acetyltransferase